MVLEGWDGTNVRHAAALILEAREASGAGPWSVVEVLDDGDFAALRKWAGVASPGTIEHLLRSTDYVDLPPPRADDRHPKAAVIGLVLAALFAMAAGRSTTTSAPWKAVAEVLEGTPLRMLLISGAGPTPVVRDALLTAARAFDLRSGDLAASDEHRWYHLLRLQGGIPPADLVNLPTWLAVPQAQPRVVRELALVPSFAKAWRGLVDFQNRVGNRDSASRALNGCRFFGAAEALVLDAAGAVRRVLSSAPEPVEVEPMISAELALTWAVAGRAPIVLVTPRLHDEDGLGARVDVDIDGVPRFGFRRRDGKLRCLGSSTVEAPLAQSYSVTARSAGDTSTVVIELFDLDEETALFDRDGRKTDSEARAAFLVSRYPLERRGVEARYLWVENARLAVAELAAGVELSIYGSAVWPTRALVPPLVDIVPVAVVVDASARSVTVTLEHPAHVVVRAAYGCGEPYALDAPAAVDEATGLARSVVRGTVHPASARPELPLLLRLSVGDESCQRTVRVRTFSAAAVGGAWLDPTAALERRLVEGGAISVQLGQEHTGRDAQLVALGSGREVPANGRGRASLRVPGYGEPLRLVGGPSWDVAAPSSVLAASIVDHGDLRSHACAGNTIVVHHGLAPGFETDDDHWLLVWPRKGPLRAVCVRPAEGEPAALVADWTEEPPRAVALCYDRHVLGASWDASWPEDLGATRLPVPELLCLVRLLHLPILAPAAWRHVVALLEPHLAEVIGEHGSEADPSLRVADRTLVPSDTGELWQMVRRWILLDLRLHLGVQVDALKDTYTARHPPHAAGVQAVDGEIASAKKWFYAFVGSLLAAGALVPTDGFRAAPKNNFGKPLLHTSLNLRDEAGGTEAKVRSRRKKRIDQVLKSRHTGVEAVLAAARQLRAPASAARDAIANALLDEKTSRFVCVALLVEHVLEPSEK